MPPELMGLPPCGGRVVPFEDMAYKVVPGRKMFFLSADVLVRGERGDEVRCLVRGIDDVVYHLQSRREFRARLRAQQRRRRIQNQSEQRPTRAGKLADQRRLQNVEKPGDQRNRRPGGAKVPGGVNGLARCQDFPASVHFKSGWRALP